METNVRNRPAPEESAALDPTSEVVQTAAPGVLARLGAVLPAVDSIVTFVYRTASASALAAALIVLAAIDVFPTAAASVSLWWLVFFYAILVIPAAATALLGWTLADLARLPGQLREAAMSAARGAKASAGEMKSKSRLGSVFRAVWAARGLALGPRDALVKTIAAARFVRLASLPFVLALVVLFVVNGAVVFAGIIALVVLIL